MKPLRQQYDDVYRKYLIFFATKQVADLEPDEDPLSYLDYTAGAEFVFMGDACLSFSDIRHDVDTQQPEGLIFEWYWKSIDHPHTRINYKSYCMGARFVDSESTALPCSELQARGFSFDDEHKEMHIRRYKKSLISGKHIHIHQCWDGVERRFRGETVRLCGQGTRELLSPISLEDLDYLLMEEEE